MEICVNVTNPPATVDLVFNIITEYQTRTGTASNNYCGIINFINEVVDHKIIYVGGADFTPIGPFTGFNFFLANSPIRRDCFNVTITNDDITEIDETFTLVLRQDPFSPPTSSLLIQPNTTRITIWDGVGTVVFHIIASGYRIQSRVFNF